MLLFDIGGGSSELVWLGNGSAASPEAIKGRIRVWTSLSLGVVTLADRFGGRDVAPAVFESMVSFVSQAMADFIGRVGDRPRCPKFHLLGTSGTVTTVAGVFLGLPRYDRRQVDGLWMSDTDVATAMDHLRAMPFGSRVAHGCIGADRADLVLAGCAILEAIRRAFPSERLRIADRGLREGILMHLMSRDNAWALLPRPQEPLVTQDGNGGVGGRAGGRSLKIRVKTARKRSLSSTLWLQRQLNDPYVALAKREGYRSRAAFKLLEVDDKYRLLRPGQRIVDLGAAPGGWAQIAAQRTGADKGRGQVVAIDLLSLEPIPGVSFTQMDFLDADAPDRVRAMLAGSADGVLSDMAANATGHRKTDHLKIVALVELAAAFASEVLSPDGFFLAKVLQGGTEGSLLAGLKRDFKLVRHVKPEASRKGSSELYVLATGFRGAASGASAGDALSAVDDIDG